MSMRLVFTRLRVDMKKPPLLFKDMRKFQAESR